MVVLVEAQGKTSVSTMSSETEDFKRAVIEAKSKIQTSISSANESQTQSEESIDLPTRDVIAKAYAELVAKPERDLTLEEWETRAYGYELKAYAHGSRNSIEEAIRCWDKIASIPNAPALNVVKALLNKGYALGKLGGHAKAELQTYNQVLERFGIATDPALRKDVAQALINIGIAMNAQGQYTEEIAAYDDLLRRFGTDPAPSLRVKVAQALNNKGVTLNTLNKREEGIAVYDELVARFSASVELPLRIKVAYALINKGDSLNSLNRYADEIEAYNELFKRFSTATELPLRILVARSLAQKSAVFRRLNQNDDAAHALKQLEENFGDASEVGLNEIVKKTRGGQTEKHYDRT
jgi:tetratricopeptide (TPR) repeat protein